MQKLMEACECTACTVGRARTYTGKSNLACDSHSHEYVINNCYSGFYAINQWQ